MHSMPVPPIKNYVLHPDNFPDILVNPEGNSRSVREGGIGLEREEKGIKTNTQTNNRIIQ